MSFLVAIGKVKRGGFFNNPFFLGGEGGGVTKEEELNKIREKESLWR